MKRNLKGRRGERGTNVIEFALLFPVYLIFMGLLCDYGIFFLRRASYSTVLTDGCREGAMVDPNDPSRPPPTTVAKTYTDNKLTVLGTGATSNVTLVGTVPNRSVRCEITEPFTALFLPSGLPGIELIFPNNVEVVSEVRLEWQRS